MKLKYHKDLVMIESKCSSCKTVSRGFSQLHEIDFTKKQEHICNECYMRKRLAEKKKMIFINKSEHIDMFA